MVPGIFGKTLAAYPSPFIASWPSGVSMKSVSTKAASGRFAFLRTAEVKKPPSVSAWNDVVYRRTGLLQVLDDGWHVEQRDTDLSGCDGLSHRNNRRVEFRAVFGKLREVVGPVEPLEPVVICCGVQVGVLVDAELSVDVSFQNV